MRWLTFIITALLMSNCGNSQDFFCGIIKYKQSIESKNPNIPMEFLTNNLGTESTFYYQDGNYLQEYKDGRMEFGFLNVKDKLFYRKYRDNDTLFIADATKYQKYQFNGIIDSDKKKAILGFICKMIDLEAIYIEDGNSYKMTYFYSDKIQINKSFYNGLKYAFMDELYSKMESLPLEYIMTSKTFVMTATAVDIQETNAFNILNDFDSRKKNLVLKYE
jgi:hypothetical protein